MLAAWIREKLLFVRDENFRVEQVFPLVVHLLLGSLFLLLRLGEVSLRRPRPSFVPARVLEPMNDITQLLVVVGELSLGVQQARDDLVLFIGDGFLLDLWVPVSEFGSLLFLRVRLIGFFLDVFQKSSLVLQLVVLPRLGLGLLHLYLLRLLRLPIFLSQTG